ncbi:hypothetical protein RND71_001187 [Anisodus tanguticus]|uniref:Uncharacterized protein n=1 Tax=Anisodus tanguticus TaxID=243964 RepID=A0AAE1T0W0_9SOLA|nr:hypothetical protein RND71_001187 [Anisodus tanguticus]
MWSVSVCVQRINATRLTPSFGLAGIEPTLQHARAAFSAQALPQGICPGGRYTLKGFEPATLGYMQEPFTSKLKLFGFFFILCDHMVLDHSWCSKVDASDARTLDARDKYDFFGAPKLRILKVKVQNLSGQIWAETVSHIRQYTHAARNKFAVDGLPVAFPASTSRPVTSQHLYRPSYKMVFSIIVETVVEQRRIAKKNHRKPPFVAGTMVVAATILDQDSQKR